MFNQGTNVFLVGMMAVGKTTVGRHLAAELALDFYDADLVIEERAGADIAWIFDIEGEAGFREREVQVIDLLTQQNGIVLATGGGVVLREENRRHLRERGTVVYLKAPIERLVERTAHDKRRPLLQGADAVATLTRLSNERGPLYTEVADLVVVADRDSAKSLAKEIARRLRADTKEQRRQHD